MVWPMLLLTPLPDDKPDWFCTSLVILIGLLWLAWFLAWAWERIE